MNVHRQNNNGRRCTQVNDRSFFPSRLFFPMSGTKDGCAKSAENMKAEIDTEKIEAFRGTVSLPFTKGLNAEAVVKIIDDMSIESLKVILL